ncbi:hypothetical protein [Runella salmonicolor]|uniref:Uncharacterized protein n=1 Tax=Runella salmonicolor TaxID=2950278 RepID=A0ABT1FH72_9BACT|nr:hypothetical protein [Runella salmonicolor]MCP1381094.1 hypothetical protein [Runella salmonicolor]
MTKALRFTAIFLLLFNGIGALYGGGLLIIDPTGGKLQLPLSYLQHAPFKDYLIPGIVLFLGNGVLSCVVSLLTFTHHKRYAHFIVLQGGILTGWILIQVLMVQTVYQLHYVMGAVGLALIGIGSLIFIKDTSK